jgi:hypothetical protein
VAFVNAATFNSGATAVTSQATTLPTYSAGDTLILAVSTQGGASQVLGGLGAWTLTPNGRMDNATGNTQVLAVYRIENATGSETAPTITLTSRRICGFIASFSGRATSGVVATDHGSTNAASTSCTEGTGITVTDGTSDIGFIGAAQTGGTYTPPASPGTWTERVDITTGTAAAQNSCICLHTSTQPTGATGAVTSAMSGTFANNAYLMELKPAGAATGQPYAQRVARGKAPGVWYPGRG